jgi:hypothetical protein
MKRYHVSRCRKILPFPAQWNIGYQSSDESAVIHGAKLNQAYGFEEKGMEAGRAAGPVGSLCFGDFRKSI